MSDRVRWGLLAAGRIAGAFAKALPHSRTGELVGVASRSQEKADKFGDEFGVPKRYADYQAMLDDPEIDAVYVSTPHPWHAEWAIKACDAGKHVLCEKPIALNALDAQAIVEAAIRNDVFLMEAFMYRCNPLTVKLYELVRDGAIGEVRMIRATFSFDAGYNLEGRILNNRLGGGGILDVGCYTVSAARLVAGAAQGKPFADPIDVKGVGHVGAESRCDEWAAAVLRFPGDIVAQCATGVRLGMDSAVDIYGADGRLSVSNPWFGCGREGGTGVIQLHRRGADAEEVRVEGGWLYAIEADTVGDNLERRQAPAPAMSWDDTLGNMRTLDRWREEVGVAYEGESPEAYKEPLDRRPLRVRESARMTYGELEGVARPISRLAIGSVPHAKFQRAALAYDEFFARGGNCFDTAHIYGGGENERALGEWFKTRGVREQCVLIVKGAHTPHCFPDAMREQLEISLDRLGTDYTDLYFLHRDNVDVPVGEWVDALEEQVQAGRIRAFGGSNWTLERLQAAIAYAQENGKRGFSAVSNNFSLARMVDPVWAGCVSSSQPEYKAWHEQAQFPVFAWSSQAQGFFAPGRAAPDKTQDQGLVRCWYAEDNFRRLERVKQMAAERGVSTIAIALAYVLNQPFPTFALYGPADLSETRTSFEALDLELSPEDLKWLNLEA